MPKISINTKELNRIPLNEYYLEDYKHKGLVFVQHGYQSNKSYGADYLALELARKGYFVVSIDASKHGDRKEEPFITGSEKDKFHDAYNVVKKTALEIIKLHRHHYSDYPTYDFIGVSLGGMIAYYLATKTDKVRKLIPVISTPDFMSQAHYSVDMAKYDETEFFTKEKVDFINSINPINRLDKMKYRELHILVGTKDNRVPSDVSINFYNDFKTFNMTLDTFDTNHNVPRDMQLKIFEYIEK